VDTRHQKLLNGDYDAIILACAGLERLGLEVQQVPLPTDLLMPAPGQGALALQTREDDRVTRELLAVVNDVGTQASVRAERRFMWALDAACRLPVAALAQAAGGELRMDGLVATLDGRTVLRDSAIAGSLDEAEQLGQALADTLHQKGARRLLEALV
jgi:hydroxymethylbilane synthase